MKLDKGRELHWWLMIIFLMSSMGIPGEQQITPRQERHPATEHWKRTYQEFHDLVVKLDDQVSRNFFPEFMIIKEGNRIATLQLDSFGARVLREADDVLLPYREGLERCIEAQENEYRPARLHSFERFAWFLDRYVKSLTQAVGGGEEEHPSKGVRERVVTSDRSLYATTRLISAYLEERLERNKKAEATSYAADRAMESSVSDVARRVFRLDLTQKFDRKELLEKGAASQPVFRDLASHEAGQSLGLGLDPLSTLTRANEKEPVCEIALTLKKTAAKN